MACSRARAFVKQPSGFGRLRGVLALAAWPFILPCLEAQDNEVVVSSTGGIAAIIGREVVTYGEVDRSVDERIAFQVDNRPISPAIIEQFRPQLRWQVLQSMVEEALLLQEAARKELAITDAHVDRYIDDRIAVARSEGENIQSAEDFYRILQDSKNISRAEYRKKIRRELLANALLWNFVFQANEFVPPGELRAYYRNHIDEFQTPSELTFRVIVVNPREESDAGQMLQAIEDGLDGGVPFEELARQFSSVYSRSGGLVVRKFDEVKSWHPPLPDRLRRMKPGQIQRRILTTGGWYYIKMEAVEPGETESFEDVQEAIKLRILSQRREEDKREFVESLRRRTFVKVFLSEPENRDVAKRLPTESPDAEPDKPTEDTEGPRIQDVSPEAPLPKKKEREPEGERKAEG